LGTNSERELDGQLRCGAAVRRYFVVFGQSAGNCFACRFFTAESWERKNRHYYATDKGHGRKQFGG
jgi:hypothetical protein